MRLRTKLLPAQAPLLVALAGIAWAATSSLGALGRRADAILRENFRSVLAAQRMKESAERIDSGVLFAAAGRADTGAAQVREHVAALEGELAVQETNITEAGEHDATAALRAAWTDYRARLDAYAALASPEERIDAYFSDVGPSFVRVKDAANRVLEINQDAMVHKSDQAARASARLAELVMIGAIVACALGAAATAYLTARLLRPIGVLQQTARRLGEGDLVVRARVAPGDEIGALADEFNAMADRLQRYRESTLGELLEAQNALHAAIDSLPDPVLVVGAAGDVRDANAAAERVLGAALVHAHGPTIDLLPEPVRSAVVAARDRALSGAAPLPGDLREAVHLDRPDGPIVLLPRASPVRSADGDVVAATVLLQDVTRLTRLAEMKDDLVATVAHEFRTPLTSLRMAIHLCLEEAVGPTTEKQRDLLAASRADCERLQRLVDDMLDLARIRAGKAALALRPVDADWIVRGALAAAEAPARERHVILASEVSPEAGDVLADPERIGVALQNLVANAVRISPEGRRVVVSALLAPVPRSAGTAVGGAAPRESLVGGAGPGSAAAGSATVEAAMGGGSASEGAAVGGAAGASPGVRFEVSDEGPGVPEELRDTIFERGTRGASGGAAGLGLWIAREIVRAHGGEIGVEPTPGGGSRFWFTVPRAATRAS